MSEPAFDQLLEQGLTAPFSGWDFSFLRGRTETVPLPWSYSGIVAALSETGGPLLDMGTGGGEVLAGLAGRPARTVATEAWPPNVPVAAARLTPLGIPVIWDEGATDNFRQEAEVMRRGLARSSGALPFRADAFRLVASRHEAFLAAEVARVLAPGGWFVTQQVDYHSSDDLCTALALPPPDEPASWLPLAREQAERAGLEVRQATVGAERLRFHDVGALAYYLRAVSWAIPGLDLRSCRPVLARLHEQMQAGPLIARLHRFLLTARKPA